MTRLYTPKPLVGVAIAPHFFFKYAPEQTHGPLFAKQLPNNFFEKSVIYVDSAESADAIVLPNNFYTLDAAAWGYIALHAADAERAHIPLFLFSYGDFTDALSFDARARFFRLSTYSSEKNSHDIVAPTITEDIGAAGITLRPKQQIPMVSFCGKAGFGSMRETLASWARKIRYELAACARPNRLARIRGVFWRQWVIRACERSGAVKTHFIIRTTFSGALKTIQLSPEQARREFIASIEESDFVLAPKGDGNYSNRFLEALSMGRIPVLVDTDVVLPLEDKIDYSKIIVRVPMSEVKETPRYIRAFYDSLSDEEWRERQRRARQVFEQYLQQNTFFTHVFENLH